MTCCFQRVSTIGNRLVLILHQCGRSNYTDFWLSSFTAGAQTLYRRLNISKTEAKTLSTLNLDVDGTWTQNVEFSNQNWHAGKSSWAGIKNLNSHSIGIEVCNPGPLTIVKGGYKTWWGKSIDSDDITEAPSSMHVLKTENDTVGCHFQKHK